MVANSKSDPNEVYDRKLDEEYDYWLPVIAGIATHEEVDRMTAKQLGVANAAARLKINLFGKGG
ncbi:hypothetical protein [Peribacillus asahii]|uniref:hypothetical protein n=1 Tax=Peribacillus asahii TaxID=228899 RepID=UPI00207ACC8E|nr:hypothetical protein [Peribacillus asahii]USK71765.1 hypothetical protein LIS76_08430 [Peribacillus asahii]